MVARLQTSDFSPTLASPRYQNRLQGSLHRDKIKYFVDISEEFLRIFDGKVVGNPILRTFCASFLSRW